MSQDLIDQLRNCDDMDRSYWMERATNRLQALDEDEPVFGLVPSEHHERRVLRQLIEDMTNGVR